MHGYAFMLTAPADLTIAPDSSGTFTVTNSGTQPLVVHESLGRYTAKTLQFPAADHATLTAFSGPWLTVSPQSFTLKPGQSETVRITSHVPAGTTGDHFLNVVWTAKPARATAGNLHLAGAVATTVTIPEPGVAVAVTTHGPAAAPAVPAAGLGAGLIGALAFTVLVVLVIVL